MAMTLEKVGFNNIPPTDVAIDPRGYTTNTLKSFDDKGNAYELMTGAQLRERFAALGIEGNPQYVVAATYIVYTGAITKGALNDLGGFSLVFANKATDALGNKYDVKVDYKTVTIETGPDYALDYAPIAYLRDGLVDTSTQNATGAPAQYVISGDHVEVEISVLENDNPTSKTTTLAFRDVDTEDGYNRLIGTPSDTGNGYFAGNGKVWTYQESVAPNIDGVVYADPDTCELLDENTGFIGNACSSELSDDLVSSIAFNVTLPHVLKINSSRGGMNYFTSHTTLRSAKITASKVGDGAITNEGDKDYLIGADATYTMTPAEGMRIEDVKVDGRSVGAVDTYTFTDIQEDHTIEVIFAPDGHKIRASAGNGGSISDEGETYVSTGGSKTYTITPNAEYEISDVTVDGRSVGKVSSYTFDDVQEDHVIIAYFKKSGVEPGPIPCDDPPIYIVPPKEDDCGCCEELRKELAGKQDKLTAGDGITIEQDGDETVISSTGGGLLELFIPVNELPEPSEAEEHAIYLTPNVGGGVEEWHVVNGEWDKFGEADIDLSGYVKEEDVTKEYLLAKLGYTEIPVSLTADGVTRNYIFLGKEDEPEPIGTFNTIDHPSIELLRISRVSNGEVILELRDRAPDEVIPNSDCGDTLYNYNYKNIPVGEDQDLRVEFSNNGWIEDYVAHASYNGYLFSLDVYRISSCESILTLI